MGVIRPDEKKAFVNTGRLVWTNSPWPHPSQLDMSQKPVWGKRSALECLPNRECCEADFQIPNGIAAQMGRYRHECHCNLGQVLR